MTPFNETYMYHLNYIQPVTYIGTDFEDCGDNTDLLSLWILLNTT